MLTLSLLGLGMIAPRCLMATTYYVSPSGLDTNPGTSPALAWQTLAQVNATLIQPGDSILLEGGQTFAGNLNFAAPRLGTALNPIYIGSYGTGRATIDAGNAAGIYVYDGAGFEIAHLNVVGSGRATNPGSGISFYTEEYNLFRHDSIYIHHVEVSGFNGGGITVEANEDFTLLGYENIRITDAVVHDNGDHGIYVLGGVLVTGHCHRNVYIARCTAYNNPGKLGKIDAHTGSGIIASCCEGALIEYCTAYGNGAGNLYPNGGPVGIWLWDTKDGIIQFCESYNNQTGSLTGSGKDGGGFDLDGGCVNCILQYNYSHGNEGAGYLIAEYDTARPLRDCIVRYNISENDGRANDYAGIMLYRAPVGVLSNIRIHNNVVYTGPSGGTTPWAFQSISDNTDSILIANNIFITAGTARMAYISHGPADGTNLFFQNNCYYHIGGTPYFFDQGAAYNSLAAWRAGRGQEMLGGVPLGWQTDPLLNDAGNGGLVGDPFLLPTLTAYHLQGTSPLIDQALKIDSIYGLSLGLHDFYLNSIPGGTALDVGAHEVSGGVLEALQGAPGEEALAEGGLKLIPAGPQAWIIEPGRDHGPWLRLRVRDLSGRTVLDTQPSTQETLSFSLEGSSSGLYLLELIGSTGSIVRKLRLR